MTPGNYHIERELRQLVEGDVLFDDINRQLMSYAACIYKFTPMGIVAPKNTEDVSKLLDFCHKRGITVTARGGGSSLAGQALGEGIIVDFTTYLNRILEIDPEKSIVRVQPGITYGGLNQELKKYGKVFAPDPSSGDFCTIGGCVANNSGGAHSLKYGLTREHTLGLEVVLHDGTVIDTRRMSLEEARKIAKRNPSFNPALSPLIPTPLPVIPAKAGIQEIMGIEEPHEITKKNWIPASAGMTINGINKEESRIYRELIPLLETNQDIIQKYSCRIRKNSSGYDVLTVLENETFDLTPLLVGSEGTLGLVTEATFNLEDLPKAKRSALIYFDSYQKAGEAVVELNKLDPAALEFMDRTFLGFVREGKPKLRHLLDTDIEALLLLEFYGENESELNSKMDRARQAMLDRKFAYDFRLAKDAKEENDIWTVRKAALPIIYKSSPTKKPMHFIDDVAVEPKNLAPYIQGLREILKSHNTDVVIYGHAGSGNVHVNPLMNPHDADFVDKMKSLMDHTFDLVLKLNGTIDGEHGDGIVRSRFVPKQFGPLFDVFVKMKQIFDPKNILNPGKIIPDPDLVPEDHLRWSFIQNPSPAFGGTSPSKGEEKSSPQRSEFNLPSPLWGEGRARPERSRGGEGNYGYVPTNSIFDTPELRHEIEKCHGCGTCRSYCPTAIEFKSEPSLSRSKAVLLRGVITGDIDFDQIWTNEDFKKTIDYCINCKLCLTDCPTAVDIPMIAIKAREIYVEKKGGQPLKNFLLGNSELSSKINSVLAPVANFAMKNSLNRKAMEAVTGIDARRELPAFTPEFQPRHRKIENPAARVAYFVGCFGRFNNPDGEAQATVDLLEHNGVVVVVPEQHCCGIAKFTLGSGEEVRDDAMFNIDHFYSFVEKGYDIVASAPSCGLAIKEDWYPLLVGTDYEKKARTVKEHTYDIHEYLMKLLREGKLDTNFKPQKRVVVHHNPCHLKAQGVGEEVNELLRLVPGVTVKEIKDSCCGIAGTYGMKTENFDASMNIGNRLFEEIREAGVDTVATSCGTCNIQIAQGLKGMDIVHTIDLLRYQ